MDLQNAIRRQANGAGRGCARFLRALLRRGRCLRAAEDGSRDAAGGEVGSALIETAASLPVLFVLIFCFMELCMAFYSYDMISESAREGTRYAMLLSSTCTNSSGGSCTATAAQVNSYVSGLGWANLAGGTMTVSTTYKTPAGGVGTNTVSDCGGADHVCISDHDAVCAEELNHPEERVSDADHSIRREKPRGLPRLPKQPGKPSSAATAAFLSVWEGKQPGCARRCGMQCIRMGAHWLPFPDVWINALDTKRYGGTWRT